MIRINNLSFSYKTRVISSSFYKNLMNKNETELYIFKNLSIDFLESENIVGLLGKNGAGKTTLIKLLCGVLTPNTGSIDILGGNVSSRSKDLLRNLGVVFGNKSMLWDELSLYENIELFSTIYKAKFNEQLKSHFIELLSLQNIINKPAKTYSLGQSVKANLLIHMLNQPKLLILDEPTIGLDIEAQLVLRMILKDYINEYKSKVLITSHNMMDISHVCENIAFIGNGEVKKIKLDSSNSKEKNAIYLEGLFA